MTAERIELIRMQSMEEFGFGPTVMKKIKKCPQCGRMSPAGEAFCRECGSRLPQKTLYDFYKSLHKVCPVCDSVAPDGAEFCPVCGASLEREAG